MKNILKKVTCVALLFGIVLTNVIVLSACNFNYYYEIAVSSVIYDDSEQKINVYFTNENDSTTFKTTISTDDIKFEGDLVGRTATKVEIITGRRLEITLGGKCSVSSTASSKNRIIILSNATSDDRNYAYIASKVLVSGLISSSNENTVNDNIGSFTSVFKVTDGASFEEEFLTAQFISITNGNGAEEIEVQFDSEKQEVTVIVDNFTVTSTAEKPILKFAINTTSLEKEIFVSVG